MFKRHDRAMPLTNPIGWMHFRSPVSLSLTIATLFLVLFNLRFWKETVSTLWGGSITGTLFIGSLFLVLLFIHTTFFLLMPGKRAMQLSAASLFIVGAIAAYAADNYGVFIDKDMIRNVFETDQREATALLNLRFIVYLVGLGLLPAVLILRVRLASIGIKRQLLHRLGFIAAGLVATILMVLALSAHYSSFVREHKNLRFLLVPGAALNGTVTYARSTMADPQAEQLVDTDGTPNRSAKPDGDKPLLIFLVVGETARSHNFQLAGYDRPTNPELAKLKNVYYFNNVLSCGTSTAISLPCMFSHLGREHFSVSAAKRATNLLDALAKAGVEVQWHDNNSGSKGVSARVKNINFDQKRDPALCNEESCFDEIMLKDLPQTLDGIKSDAVIAFHQIGSHGPAYFRRYPEKFEAFKPVCRTNELNQCSKEEIRNAYDNTILYADHNLARQIEMLKGMSSRFDSLFIYVSDHGESLGENGLYLHGAPYMFAPDDQKKVPFILWMSDGYRQRFAINQACVQSQLSKPFSHDNLYHTILGAMAVKNDVYRPGMDMLDVCRSAP